MGATEVLVVGAGPAGLTMANVLDRQGVSFRNLGAERSVGA